ncbi:MAG TPA: hypothetical protein VGI34_05580, partial [Candidatus Acidoferrales bacterium]
SRSEHAGSIAIPHENYLNKIRWNLVCTIRSWEQGHRVPKKPALRLLMIAKEQPPLHLHRSDT